jgi:hypothetical protein
MVINTNAALKLINKYFKMKSKAKELDVDFIGGQGPLTKEEQQKISKYIKAQKQQEEKAQSRTTKTLQRKKALA